jgi:hypothetical protein
MFIVFFSLKIFVLIFFPKNRFSSCFCPSFETDCCWLERQGPTENERNIRPRQATTWAYKCRQQCQFLSLMNTHSLSLSLNNKHLRSLFPSPSLSLSVCLSRSLSLSLTNKHSLSNKHTHAFSLSHCDYLSLSHSHSPSPSPSPSSPLSLSLPLPLPLPLILSLSLLNACKQTNVFKHSDRVCIFTKAKGS